MTSRISSPSPVPAHADARLQKIELAFRNYTLYTDNPKDTLDLNLLKENILENGGLHDIEGSRMSGIVTVVERSRRFIRVELASLDFAARMWIVFEPANFSAELYDCIEKHLALGDRIIVTIANVYRDNHQVTSDAVMCELVAPNLMDWDDSVAFEARCLSEALQVRAMHHRTALLGVGCRYFFPQPDPLNLTDDSPYVPVNYPNIRLLNAARMSGRPAFMLSTIPATDELPREYVYDIVMLSSAIADEDNDLEVSPQNLVFYALKHLGDDLCGGFILPSIIKTPNGYQIDLSVTPLPIRFYDLIVRETELDFRTYATVEEALDAVATQGLVLPTDGKTYHSVVEVAVAVARHIVFPSLIEPTLVVHFPAYEYGFAHRYGSEPDDETSACEIFIGGKLVASYYTIETDPRLVDLRQLAPAHYDANDLKSLVYAGLEPMTRMQIFIDNVLALFKPGIE